MSGSPLATVAESLAQWIEGSHWYILVTSLVNLLKKCFELILSVIRIRGTERPISLIGLLAAWFCILPKLLAPALVCNVRLK